MKRLNTADRLRQVEVQTMALPQEQFYTINDIYALPEGQRAELIDGRLYMMAPPMRIHQKSVSQFTKTIGSHIDAKHGDCEVYPAPFALILNEDDRKLCRAGYQRHM